MLGQLGNVFLWPLPTRRCGPVRSAGCVRASARAVTEIPRAQVENGKNAMPAWADRLDGDEIAAVAAYVYNQADTNGW